jgi:hypothetical protein
MMTRILAEFAQAPVWFTCRARPMITSIAPDAPAQDFRGSISTRFVSDAKASER